MLYSSYLTILDILGPPDHLVVTNAKQNSGGEEEIKEVEAWWRPVFDRTLSDCVYGNHKGCIDRLVLNRIECNLRYIKYRLEQLFYFPAFYVSKEFPWDRIHYFRRNNLNGIEQNIKNMQEAFTKRPDTPSIVLSAANSLLRYEQINLIEYSLYDINQLIDILYENSLYSNTCYSGENFYGWE